jgi:hypothetical protein
MIDKIIKLFSNKYTGALADDRSELDKIKDYTHEELFGAGAVEWLPWDESKIPSTTIRDQDGSGSCGAFTLTKVLSLNNVPEKGYRDLLPAFVYNLRYNKPGEGMAMFDLLKIAVTNGATDINPFSYEKVDEKTINSYVPTLLEKDNASEYRAKNYVYIDPQNTDQIYEAVKNGYYPIILLRCLFKEWTETPYLTQGYTGQFEMSHYVPIIYGGLRDGKQMFLVDDSWGSSYGKNGRRYVSAEWIRNRVASCAYTVDLSGNLPAEPTFPKINRVLSIGMKNDSDVKNLQDILKYAGFMDKSIPSTGNYFTMTANAVYKFQVANNVDTIQVLQKLAGKSVGPKTLAVINKKYGAN